MDGTVVQSSEPSAQIRTSPSKVFGSGKAIVASVPVISTNPARLSGESKLKVLCADSPPSNSRMRADVRRDRDGEFLAGLGPGADDAGFPGLGAEGGHPADAAEGLHEGGQVVRADVEQRSGAVLEQEVRVRVPGFRAGGLHQGQRGERLADVAALDHPAGGLDAGAEERVRGAAQPHARRRRGLRAVPGRFPVQGERLLAPDMLAGLEARVATSTWAAGIVRLTTISTSGCRALVDAAVDRHAVRGRPRGRGLLERSPIATTRRPGSW